MNKIETIIEHKEKHSFWETEIVESDGSIWCSICGARLRRPTLKRVNHQDGVSDENRN